MAELCQAQFKLRLALPAFQEVSLSVTQPANLANLLLTSWFAWIELLHSFEWDVCFKFGFN